HNMRSTYRKGRLFRRPFFMKTVFLSDKNVVCPNNEIIVFLTGLFRHFDFSFFDSIGFLSVYEICLCFIASFLTLG
ncbi:hypothetical protein, partial [Aliivibrio fischeri]|uniref:hypothetical protein n=1 Tax=Aliivibrio fischeri TaxID=668 RepID=UPI001BFFD8DC